MRYRTYYPKDNAPQPDRDPGFRGVDPRRDPGVLEPGLAADATNLMFRQGLGETRFGFETHAWGHDYGIADLDAVPDLDDFSFDQPCGFGEVLGAGVFSDPDGQEMVLVATALGVWRLAANTEPQLLGINGAAPLSGPVELVQCFDRVLLFQGPNLEPLVWDPAQDFTGGANAFGPISMTPSRTTTDEQPANSYGDGTQQIPNADFAALMSNRLWVPFSTDRLAVSDILDYTRYSSAENELWVNQGSADGIVALWPYAQGQLIVFKDNSIFFLNNALGDLSQLAQQQLTAEVGLCARHAVAQMGMNVWWLAGKGRGVYGLMQTEFGLLQAGQEPVSAPIQPYLDRVNWGAAATTAQAAAFDGKFFLAVPLDGANYNNAILVYDPVNQAWAGIWSADHLDVFQFVRVQVMGQWRLAWISGTGTTNTAWYGALWSLGNDWQDSVFGQGVPIAARLLTRGYGGLTPGWKRVTAVELEVETFGPKLSATVHFGGAGEGTCLLPATTPSRTQSQRFAGKRFVLNNVNGDHGAPGRADYTVLGGDFPLYFGSKGVALGQTQRSTVRRHLRGRGPWVQVEIANAQGRMRVVHAGAEMTEGNRDLTTKL